MKKAIMSVLTVWIVVSVSLFSLLILSPGKDTKVSATTIIVDDDGTPGIDCNYTTIQEGIDAANPGDTVFVKNGIYNENVIVNKTINITGENRDTTVIDGGNIGIVIEIIADYVNLTGFSIRDSGGNSKYAGLKINSDHNKISYLNCYDNIKGIFLNYSDENHIMNNNLSYNDWDGIYSYNSNRNNVNENIFFSTNRGFYCHYSSNNTFTNNSLNLSVVLIEYSHNNIITNNSGYGCSFQLDYSNYNTIKENNFSNNLGCFRIRFSTQGSFIGNEIHSNFQYDISLEKCLNWNISNNLLKLKGIVITGTTLEHWNSHEIDILNTVNGKPIYYWKNKNGDIIPKGVGQVILANCTNITVEDLHIFNCSRGVQLGFSSYNFIINNTIIENMDSINLYKSNVNEIIGNNVSNNRRYGILLVESNNNNISQNIIHNNTNDGIYFSRASHNFIINNLISFSSNRGMVIYHSNNNTVSHNNLQNNSDSAIQLEMSDDNTVFYNNITQNNYDGIHIAGASYNNYLSYNNISGNARHGITLFASPDNNIIFNNNIMNCNSEAIYLYWACSGNIIFHNNLIDNNDFTSPQVGDESNNGNNWNTLYPYGGNYWSDYSGNDSYKGPNQDIPGSDGIGDIPYLIDADSQDNYPLMKPYKPLENYLILKQGWNLISLPFIQVEQNLTRVLGSVDGWYDAVQWFDPSNPNKPWKHQKVAKPFGNDLSMLNESMAFWIHITNPGDTIFLYNGTPPTSNQSIPLHPGWNMVGYPSLSNRNRTAALNNLTFGVELDAIWTFDAATQTWEEIGAGDFFEVGRGYWVHAAQECVWEVPL